VQKRSLIWNDFTEIDTDDSSNIRSVCKHCKKEINCGRTGTTSSMINHLKKHSKVYAAFEVERAESDAAKTSKRIKREDVSQQTIQMVLASRNPYEKTSRKAKELDNLLLSLICKEGLAFNLLDSLHFRDFVAALDPRYQVPSRTLLSRTIPDAYTKCKTALIEEFKKYSTAGEYISLTTDTWTSTNNESFMSLTGHYLTENFVPHNTCIMVRNVPGSHTAENIAKELTEALAEWSLPLPSHQTVFMITDNGRNMVNAAQLANFRWKPCFAHTPQLVIEDGLKDSSVSGLKTILSKCRSIVGHFKHSSLATGKLITVQEQLGLPVHRLKQDVATQWNSQFGMLERLVEQKDAVTLCLASVETVNNITAREWVIASELKDVLQPFYDITLMMCSEKYATMSMVLK